MTIAQNIRQIRLEKGLSQENMAIDLGITTSAYGDIERGKTDLTVSRAQSISAILGVSLGVLLLESSAMLKSEIEKLSFEAAYWKEKYHNAILIDKLNNGSTKIGFKNAS